MKEDLGKEEYVKELIDYLKRGGTVQEVYQMSDTDMEVMYMAASRYYQQERFEEASDSFLFLTFLNPYNSVYWLMLGESLKMNKEYSRAVEAYTMASLNEPEDPRSYFHGAACLLQLDRNQEAYDRLKLTVLYAQENPAFGSLIEIAQELMDDVQSKLEEGA